MTVIQGGGLVLRPGEARAIDMGGIRVTVHAAGNTTDDAFSLVETAETLPGGGPPLHIHRDAAEAFFVLDGSYEMHVADDWFDCPPGSFVYVPRGMRHTFRAGPEGGRKLNLYTPAAMVGYFEELAEAIRVGADEARLNDIAERHAMEVVGPVPEGYL